VVEKQDEKYNQYCKRREGWTDQMFCHLNSVENQLMRSYVYSEDVSFTMWKSAVRSYCVRENERYNKKIKRWVRKFKVMPTPLLTSLRHDYKVASSDIDAIIRAMVTRSSPPIQLQRR
jgi:hypothetical protein